MIGECRPRPCMIEGFAGPADIRVRRHGGGTGVWTPPPPPKETAR